MSVWVNPFSPHSVGQVGMLRRHIESNHFVFDHERDLHVCPGGAKLASTCSIDQNHIVCYTALGVGHRHRRAQAKLCAGPNSIFGLP